MRKKHIFWLSLLAVVGILFAFTGPVGRAAAVSGGAGSCQTVTVPVRLSPFLPKNLNMVGDLCLPAAWAEGERRVDVLIHGGTYNRSYWDFAVDYPNYSYVERTLAEGRATFAYDRLGVGDSSRPLSALATIQAEAYVLHQIVDWIKTSDSNFAKVTLVGHSLGSFTAIEEAGTYRDVDAVVVTGLLHAVGPGTVALAASMIPALLDPQFAGEGYDPGYLTTSAGQRGVFYGGVIDPAVIAYDDVHKDVVASNTVLTSNFLLTPPALNKSSHITADVLLIHGELDATFCGLTIDCTSSAAVLTAEAPYYSGASSLDVRVVANTGHNLALHPSAGTSFTMIDQWLKAH